MPNIKPIKPFKTIDEEAKFWDTHDLSALIKDPSLNLSKLPPIESEKSEVITVRLQPSIKKRLSNLARSKGINISTLSRMWLIERLNTKP